MKFRWKRRKSSLISAARASRSCSLSNVAAAVIFFAISLRYCGILVSIEIPPLAPGFGSSILPLIVLIDGPKLAELMIEHIFGVSVKKTFEIKAIDMDIFDDYAED